MRPSKSINPRPRPETDDDASKRVMQKGRFFTTPFEHEASEQLPAPARAEPDQATARPAPEPVTPPIPEPSKWELRSAHFPPEALAEADTAITVDLTEDAVEARPADRGGSPGAPGG